MFERFTDKGRKIIILAREEAERHQNDYLGTEHLVLAISPGDRRYRPDDFEKDGVVLTEHSP
ncbi:MAG: Clp protease N-terminal domain-containing protein [Nitrospiraceae bacterium]